MYPREVASEAWREPERMPRLPGYRDPPTGETQKTHLGISESSGSQFKVRKCQVPGDYYRISMITTILGGSLRDLYFRTYTRTYPKPHSPVKAPLALSAFSLGSFRKIGVPSLGVLIIRILLFRVLY